MSQAATVRVLVTSVTDGWRVQYQDGDGQELAPERTLEARGTSPWTFPRPPGDEVEALDGTAEHHALCRANDENPLLAALASLNGREPGSKTLLPVGRYLFQVLLGDAWAALNQTPLRLELHWNPTDGPFGRFPWEMLHDGSGFLALREGTTIVRRVVGPATTLAAATTPLDVLFVVGRALRDDVIRPAAEYLALMQNLKVLGLDLKLRPRLLLEATTDSIAAALAERRPAVVHVVTHGRYEADRPFIELRSKNGSGVDKVFAANFLELLKEGSQPLPIVVLSACETAVARQSVSLGDSTSETTEEHSARPKDVAAPFAAELVEGGVPMVVGMTGPVSDLVCRLFARSFYSALLVGADAAQATAAGRRAALQHGAYDPLSTYDWALPTVFLSSALKNVKLDVTEEPLADRCRALSKALHRDSYPAFCDRLPILSAGETLLANDATQRRLWRQEQSVLALATADGTLAGDEAKRYGRTRVLKALAARAALAGHVPCLVSADFWKVDPPVNWSTFRNQLKLALSLTSRHLGVADTYRPCTHLDALLGTDEAAAPALEQQLAPHDLAAALRQDLLQLLQAIRANDAASNHPRPRRLLLLVDDLHRMGDFADTFLNFALGQLGLELCKDDVRVVFTWARQGQAHQMTSGRIRTWLSENQAKEMSLGRFESLEERLAYQHYLLNFRQQGEHSPFAVVLETKNNWELIQAFFTKLAERVRGVPSMLHKADDVIDIYRSLPANLQIVVEARDEDVMQLWLDSGGPAP